LAVPGTYTVSRANRRHAVAPRINNRCALHGKGATFLAYKNGKYEYCGSVSCLRHNCMEDLYMARSAYTKAVQLEEDNQGLIAAHLDLPQLHELALVFVVYLASVFDLVASGNGIYLTVGGTRSKDAFLLTEKGEAGNVYAGGENVIDFLEQVRDKLLTEDQAALVATLAAVTPPRKK
jgi:hypothetical protein